MSAEDILRIELKQAAQSVNKASEKEHGKMSVEKATANNFVQKAIDEAYADPKHKDANHKIDSKAFRAKIKDKEVSAAMNKVLPGFHIEGVTKDGKGLVVVKDDAKIQTKGKDKDRYKDGDLWTLTADGGLYMGKRTILKDGKTSHIDILSSDTNIGPGIRFTGKGSGLERTAHETTSPVAVKTSKLNWETKDMAGSTDIPTVINLTESNGTAKVFKASSSEDVRNRVYTSEDNKKFKIEVAKDNSTLQCNELGNDGKPVSFKTFHSDGRVLTHDSDNKLTSVVTPIDASWSFEKKTTVIGASTKAPSVEEKSSLSIVEPTGEKLALESTANPNIFKSKDKEYQVNLSDDGQKITYANTDKVTTLDANGNCTIKNLGLNLTLTWDATKGCFVGPDNQTYKYNADGIPVKS